MEGGNVRNDDALEHDELLDDYGAMPTDGPDLDSLSDGDDEDNDGDHDGLYNHAIEMQMKSSW